MVAHIRIFLLIGVISSAIYINSLQNSFHFDDQHYIVENPYIRDISNIPSFFISPEYSSFEKGFTGHYRPLLVTSYAINYAIGGMNPFGYHVVNLLFHIGSAFMVFLIVNEMSGSKRFFAALAASLIFAVHPFNSEVVNYITARSSVMCSFFYLMAFYFWVRFRGWESFYFYIASILAFILAMLTKEIAITLPVMLSLYDLYFLRKSPLTHPSPPPFFPPPMIGYRGRDRVGVGEGKGEGFSSSFVSPVAHEGFSRNRNLKTAIRNLKYYMPYIFLIVIPYLLYRIIVFGRIAGGGTRDFYANLLTQSRVLLKYLQLLFIPYGPYGLTIEHDIPVSNSIQNSSVIISVIFLLIIMSVAYMLYKKGKEWQTLSFFILWFFITLIPTTLIPLNAILQENRGYLAGIGFPVLAGVCLSKIHQRVSMPILLILISLYSIFTIQRNSAWKDDYTLWTDAVKKAPYSARAHDNLGLAYIGKGEYELAIAEFRKTLELHHSYYLAYYNAGVVYQLVGKLDLAMSAYEACLKINPQYFRAYFNLGIVYKKLGDMDKAIDIYEKAISLDSRHPFVYNNLGVALTDKGEIDRAESVFKRAIAIDPGYVKAYYNLGNIYYRMKKYDLAVEAYRDALKINPDYSEAKEMLEATVMKLSRNDKQS